MMPNTNIPPKSTLNEYIIPAAYTKLNCDKRLGCEYILRKFIDINDKNRGTSRKKAEKFNGSTISILLPVKVNEVYAFYNFEIGVTTEKL
jgi:hypothetical protein